MTPLIALLTLQGAPPPAYLKDPAYAKPITVEVALQPLEKVVAAMAKASGLPIAAAGAVRDLKATVLVKNLPVGRTMEALADTLGLIWIQDGPTLRLGTTSRTVDEEAAYRKKEADGMEKVATGEAPPIGGGPRDVASNVAGRFNGDGRTIRRRGRPRQAADGSIAKAGPRFDPDLVAVEVPDGTPPSRLDPAVPIGDSPFAKAVRAWPGVPADPGDAWSRPVAPPNPTSPWLGGKSSLADLLVAWHGASGLPVVADAFRVPVRTPGFAPNTALASLQALAASERLSLRLADGVVRLRHPAFWRFRAQEIPEVAWSPLERSGANLGSLTAFAAGLKPAQAASFRSQEAPLSKVDTAALRNAYPALVLWSSLPDAARNALLAGRAVGLAQVPGAEEAYGYALDEAPYYGAGDPSPVLALGPAKVGIFGRASGSTLNLRLAGERGEGVGYSLPAP